MLYLQIRYSIVALLSVLYILRNIKYDTMEFLGNDGQMDMLLGAAFNAVFGVNLVSLMFLLMFKWKGVTECLSSMAFLDGLHLAGTSAQLKKVSITF